MSNEKAYNEAISLLEQLISTPRTSRNESAAADLVQKNLESHGYEVHRFENNLMAVGHTQIAERQTLLLNAHIDTVKPASGWTIDPNTPTYEKIPMNSGVSEKKFQQENKLSSPESQEESKEHEQKNAKLHELEDTKLYGQEDSKLHELEDTKLHGQEDTKLYGQENSNLYGQEDSRPYGQEDSKLHELQNSRPYGQEDAKLYGLGSNDDGASLVTLMQTFYACDSAECKWNLVFIASAEEEVSGAQGMKLMAGITGEKPLFPHIDVALVGEPTGMQPAIAEKGLMVIDATVQGRSGHAARNEGINAIYRAIEVVDIVRKMESELAISPVLGPVKMTVTVMNAGTQHNVIPDLCTMTVDCRSNELYSNQQLFDMLQRRLPEWCQIKARSFCLNSSSISEEHPLIKKCVEMGLEPFGSPTLSDQALLPMPSFKMGPGQSARSHTAQEFICLSEIRQALDVYRKLLTE